MDTYNPLGSPLLIEADSSPQDGAEEFERFRDLTGKLVQVSKKELDEKLKES